MEQLFIRILNRTLLAAGVILLAAAVVGAATAAFYFWNGSNPKIVNGAISVPYTPFNPNVAASSQPGQTSEIVQPSSASASPAAIAACGALGEFVRVISSARMNISGEGAASCGKSEDGQAKAFGDQAGAFLGETKNHFKSLATDPNVRSEFPDKGDEQVKTYIGNEVDNFGSMFQSQINAQLAANEQARIDAAAQRVLALSIIGAAGAAFLSFLLIAFLIVFLRIEKHLDKLKDRVSIMPIG